MKLMAAGILAGLLVGGCRTAVEERPDTTISEPSAIETPAAEAPTSDPDAPVASTSEPSVTPRDNTETTLEPGVDRNDSGNSSAGVGGPGEGVESIAGKDAMLTPEKTDQPSVYWVDSVNNQVAFNPEAIAVSRSSPADALTTAIETLLEGESATAIPTGTELLSLDMDGNDVYINLSERFTEGGGTTSMATRMGQIIYTTTAVQEDANIWLSVEGEQLEYIGGEGLYVEQPLTRERFAQDFNL